MGFEFHPPISLKELERIFPYLKASHLKKLISERILKTEIFANKKLVSIKSIDAFKLKFNIDDFYTIAECNELLLKYNIKDDYMQCKYGKKRNFNFNISPKSLLKKGLIECDPYFGTFITKKSFDKCVNLLLMQIENNNKRNEEDKLIQTIEYEKNKLLEQKIKEWERISIQHQLKRMKYDVPKPTLTDEEEEEIRLRCTNAVSDTVSEKIYDIPKNNAKAKNRKRRNFI